MQAQATQTQTPKIMEANDVTKSALQSDKIVRHTLCMNVHVETRNDCDFAVNLTKDVQARSITKGRQCEEHV